MEERLIILNYFFPGKKGMAIGQVFVFILAAVTFALIMIFGYQSIIGFIKSGEEVTFVEFKNDLELSIKRIHTEFGALREEPFFPPGKYEQICFVNMDFSMKEEGFQKLELINFHAASVLRDARSAVQDRSAVQGGVQREQSGYDFVDENVFMNPTAPVKLKVYKIKLYEWIDNENQEVAFLCSTITLGKFTLGMEGGGDHTKIFLPSTRMPSTRMGDE